MGKKITLFAEALISVLRHRFPELERLCDLDIFDLRNRHTAKDWGLKEIKRLFVTFLKLRVGEDVTEETIALEWQVFVQQIPKILEDHEGEVTDAAQVLEILLWEKSTYFFIPNVLEICAIAHTLSFSTATVESSSSKMKVIKKYRTNGMSQELLDDLLQIVYNGPAEMPEAVSLRLAKVYMQESGERHFRTNDASMQTKWGEYTYGAQSSPRTAIILATIPSLCSLPRGQPRMTPTQISPPPLPLLPLPLPPPRRLRGGAGIE
jgi:hypothetical protein